jgi:hypothetical protein
MFTSQSNASVKPSFFVADVLKIFHYLSLILVRPSASVSSTSVMAPVKSYLFARMRRGTPFRSSSASIVNISALLVSTRSRSMLSIT